MADEEKMDGVTSTAPVGEAKDDNPPSSEEKPSEGNAIVAEQEVKHITEQVE